MHINRFGVVQNESTHVNGCEGGIGCLLDNGMVMMQ